MDFVGMDWAPEVRPRPQGQHAQHGGLAEWREEQQRGAAAAAAAERESETEWTGERVGLLVALVLVAAWLAWGARRKRKEMREGLERAALVAGELERKRMERVRALAAVAVAVADAPAKPEEAPSHRPRRRVGGDRRVVDVEPATTVPSSPSEEGDANEAVPQSLTDYIRRRQQRKQLVPDSALSQDEEEEEDDGGLEAFLATPNEALVSPLAPVNARRTRLKRRIPPRDDEWTMAWCDDSRGLVDTQRYDVVAYRDHSESAVSVPPPSLVDACHALNALVLGTVLRRDRHPGDGLDDRTTPLLAAKLVALARQTGFDGWLLCGAFPPLLATLLVDQGSSFVAESTDSATVTLRYPLTTLLVQRPHTSRVLQLAAPVLETDFGVGNVQLDWTGDVKKDAASRVVVVRATSGPRLPAHEAAAWLFGKYHVRDDPDVSLLSLDAELNGTPDAVLEVHVAVFVLPTEQNDVGFFLDVEAKSGCTTRLYLNPRATHGKAVVRKGALAPEPLSGTVDAVKEAGGWDVRTWRTKTAAWRGGRLKSFGARVCPWLGAFATVVLDVRVGSLRIEEVS